MSDEISIDYERNQINSLVGEAMNGLGLSGQADMDIMETVIRRARAEARKAALEEAAKALESYADEWKQHGGTLASPHGHLSVDGLLRAYAKHMRALAAKEGGGG